MYIRIVHLFEARPEISDILSLTLPVYVTSAWSVFTVGIQKLYALKKNYTKTPNRIGGRRFIGAYDSFLSLRIGEPIIRRHGLNDLSMFFGTLFSTLNTAHWIRCIFHRGVKSKNTPSTVSLINGRAMFCQSVVMHLVSFHLLKSHLEAIFWGSTPQTPVIQFSFMCNLYLFAIRTCCQRHFYNLNLACVWYLCGWLLEVRSWAKDR